MANKPWYKIVELNKARRLSNEEVFTENNKYPQHRLKERILNDNLIPYRCVECGNDGNHNGMPLTLQLDHINGINNDHRLDNLRFLCPNCHSQQDTYAAKNITYQKKQCMGMV